MNLTTLLLLALGALLVSYGVITLTAKIKGNQSPLTFLANVAGGAYEFGVMTRTAEEAFSTRYLLGKKGAADGSVVINGASDAPHYIVEDEPITGEVTACAVLGNATGIRTVIASGAIPECDGILTDAGGKVQAESTAAAGNYFRVGTAMSAADVDGDEVFIAHSSPVAVTVA